MKISLKKSVNLEIGEGVTGDALCFEGSAYEFRYLIRDMQRNSCEIHGLDLLTIDCPSVPVPHRIGLIQAIRVAAAKKAGFK